MDWCDPTSDRCLFDLPEDVRVVGVVEAFEAAHRTGVVLVLDAELELDGVGTGEGQQQRGVEPETVVVEVLEAGVVGRCVREPGPGRQLDAVVEPEVDDGFVLGATVGV